MPGTDAQGERSQPARSWRLEGALLLTLGATIAAAVALDARSSWDLELLAVLLLFALASDLIARQVLDRRIKASGALLAIVAATILCGPLPAATIGAIVIIGSWLRDRYSLEGLLINLITFISFPLLVGVAFQEAVEALALSDQVAAYYLFVLGAFLLALLVDYTLIIGFNSIRRHRSVRDELRTTVVPLVPSEIASAALGTGAIFAYVVIGAPGIALFAVVLISFQMLLDALLLSQRRSQQLERRAEQLTEFQSGMLSSLLHALDVRDRMTARHSAAVALYARQFAAAAGFDESGQEIAHTAGFLHDIGKFILRDDVLKAERELTAADWVEIHRHPDEGAKIIGQVDSYRPIAEIVAAHHERWNGEGYPLGLKGEEIPKLARIISICDAYDVLTARDTYRQPVGHAQALVEIRKSSGSYFDPELVECFCMMMEAGELSYRHGEDASFEAELHFDRPLLEQALAEA